MQPAPGQEILFPRALERDLLVDELRRRGATVWLVPVYRTVIANESRDPLLQALASRSVQVATFTSASAVRHFVELVGASGCATLLRGVKVACLGEVTAQAAQDRGIRPDILPPHATLEDLVGAIVRALAT
jgi:uroporphyrinogen III methyltransferase/synthase